MEIKETFQQKHSLTDNLFYFNFYQNKQYGIDEKRAHPKVAPATPSSKNKNAYEASKSPLRPRQLHLIFLHFIRNFQPNARISWPSFSTWPPFRPLSAWLPFRPLSTSNAITRNTRNPMAANFGQFLPDCLFRPLSAWLPICS